MQTDMIIANNTNIIMWEDSSQLEDIRKLFAPKLSENEFKYFVGLGKATGLNPFLREIWSVKYQDNVPAQVFIGRDGYRKAAQAHPDYEWHQPDAIYEHDSFKIINGEIHHDYNLKDRGELIGAYCLVKRRTAARPVFRRVSFKEYSTNQSLWKTKPETMIIKVAEAQALRACFQDLLAGTYGEEEMARSNEHSPQVIDSCNGQTQTERLNSILQTNNVELIAEDTSPIDTSQVIYIHDVMAEKEFSEERKEKAIQYVLKQYKVGRLEDLTTTQAQKFLLQLQQSKGETVQ